MCGKECGPPHDGDKTATVSPGINARGRRYVGAMVPSLLPIAQRPAAERATGRREYGGKGEIRTLEGLHPTRFRDEHVQPLRHLPVIGKATDAVGISRLCVVTLVRLERTASSSAGKRSNPLSYRVITPGTIACLAVECKLLLEKTCVNVVKMVCCHCRIKCL